MNHRTLIFAFLICLLIPCPTVKAALYDSDFPFEAVDEYTKAHKEEIKAVKQSWDARAVEPVFDLYDGNKLLGYVIETTGKKLLKKDPSYNGPTGNVSGYIDAKGNIIVPFGLYSALSPNKNDDGRYIWLRAYTTDKKLGVAHGVVDLNGREIVPPLYNHIEYTPGNSDSKSRPIDSFKKEYGCYLDVPAYGPSFEVETYTSNASSDVSVYGMDGSLRISHISSLSIINLGSYIATKTSPSTSILNRLSAREGTSGLNHSTPVMRLEGTGIGLYNSEGKMLLHNDYDLIEIFGSKDNKPAALDGLCYVERSVGGVKSCGIFNLKTEEWVVPTSFSEIKYACEDGKNIWQVKRDELSDFEPYIADNDYTDRFVDEGARLYNQKQYVDALNYYANNGIESPISKAYSSFSLFKIATEGFNTMNNEVFAVEHNRDNGIPWTKPLSEFDFGVCNDYLDMSLATASEYLSICNGTETSTEDKKYYRQIESLLYDIDYYKGEIPGYRKRYQEAAGYINSSAATLRANQEREQAMQAAYINAFANMFSQMISSASRPSGKKSVSSAASGASNIASGKSTGATSQSNDGPSAQWKKNRVRDLMKQRDYYLNIIDREESRSDKSTSALNLIQSSKRHLQEIEEEIRKWSD